VLVQMCGWFMESGLLFCAFSARAPKHPVRARSGKTGQRDSSGQPRIVGRPPPQPPSADLFDDTECRMICPMIKTLVILNRMRSPLVERCLHEMVVLLFLSPTNAHACRLAITTDTLIPPHVPADADGRSRVSDTTDNRMARASRRLHPTTLCRCPLLPVSLPSIPDRVSSDREPT